MIKYPNFFKPIASIVTTSFLGLTSLSQSLYAQETQVVSENNSFNWYELWDPGSTQTTRTFTNVNDSGVDVTVEYSTNQRWQEQNPNRLNLYDKKSQPLDTLNLNDSHDLWIYHGILRVTNNPNDMGNDRSISM